MDLVEDSLGVPLDAFLSRPLFAHLATQSPDGPRESPLWFHWDGEALWFIGHETATFPERVASYPRTAVGVVDFDRTSGVVQHVGLRGRATVEPFDGARAVSLLDRYLDGEPATWPDRFRHPLDTPTSTRSSDSTPRRSSRAISRTTPGPTRDPPPTSVAHRRTPDSASDSLLLTCSTGDCFGTRIG
ncbi:pyridoxamine 5'-phosphate oxidase family protein [Halomarina litorea]|uniref:pyridoxamine 5'-phosphate oxidase family protein n=1 Tax=Halomarina litorea TaxID=2961595 RepID=UPI0020C5264F|nr:pyridoxamine 5'-phosphate oxidase family protein [Halomarina sp. BCD28]